MLLHHPTKHLFQHNRPQSHLDVQSNKEDLDSEEEKKKQKTLRYDFKINLSKRFEQDYAQGSKGY